MIALQVLVKRTDKLQIAQKRVKELENELASQKKELSSKKKITNKLLTEFTSVKNAVSGLRKEQLFSKDCFVKYPDSKRVW